MFGQALQRARRACGLTQRQLADAVGVSQATVSQWQLGESAPRVERIAELERLLRMQPAALAQLLGFTPIDANSRAVMSVEEAAEADPRLGERERRILSAVYRELVQQRQPENSPPGSAP